MASSHAVTREDSQEGQTLSSKRMERSRTTLKALDSVAEESIGRKKTREGEKQRGRRRKDLQYYNTTQVRQINHVKNCYVRIV